MTANAVKGDRERCLAVGMNDYISKPIFQDVMARTLTSWLVPATLAHHASEATGEPDPGGAGQQEAAPLFDREGCLARLDGDEELLGILVKIALDDLPGTIAALVAALRDGAFEDAGRHAHSIKGAAANVGGLALAAQAGLLESMIRTGRLASVNEQAERVQDEFARFEANFGDPGVDASRASPG